VSLPRRSVRLEQNFREVRLKADKTPI